MVTICNKNKLFLKLVVENQVSVLNYSVFTCVDYHHHIIIEYDDR